MELLTSSILTLLALYVIYSEPFKLPEIIKKNKKLSYGLIIGLYLYYHQDNMEEGFNTNNLKWSKEDLRNVTIIVISSGVLFILFTSEESRETLKYFLINFLKLLKFIFYPFTWAFGKIWGKSNDE
tara:strand:- start:9 stop:386 length:378 start_codon:yes stop_codon:yes gene_type:complete